jgi:hypothetical protein
VRVQASASPSAGEQRDAARTCHGESFERAVDGGGSAGRGPGQSRRGRRPRQDDVDTFFRDLDPFDHLAVTAIANKTSLFARIGDLTPKLARRGFEEFWISLTW